MTQFMQVVKPQPEEITGDLLYPQKWYAANNGDFAGDIDRPIKCPFGKIGDIIYCREKWNYIYGIIDTEKEIIGYYHSTDGDVNKKWKSPATMPREAARLFLRITNKRVMRVQELTEQDAKIQGYGGICDCKNPVVPGACEDCYNTGYNYPPLLDLKENNESAWNSNSWMWVLDFEKTDKP